jgi:hypothetical protein
MPFDIKVDSSVLNIDFETHFRNKEWAETFGSIQKAISENKFAGSPFVELKIYFTKCQWVDPLPLLSLLIIINQYKSVGGKTTVMLPTLKENLDELNKVLKFLNDEGFLKELIKCSTVFYGSDPLNEMTLANLKESLSNITRALYYTNSTLLQACILNAKEEFKNGAIEVDGWVEEKIKIISTLISDKIPSYSQNSLLHRLKFVLVESIQNILDHAYQDQPNAFGGVYVRYRNGLDNNALSTEERKKLIKALKDETQYCPRLNKEFIELRKGCIEVFILDHGKGFTETLRTILPNSEVKYPFRLAYQLVFNEGKRRVFLNKANTTFRGGLFHIGEMVKSNQDYLCGRDENEWLGGLLPITSDNSYELIQTKSNQHISGLSWILRLSWKHETEIDIEHWSRWDGVPKLHPVYKLLQEKSNKVSAADYLIFDYRLKQSIEISNLASRKTKNDFCLLLPSINSGKFNISNLISNIASKFDESDNRVLIIGDIPEYEKQTYIAALNKIRVELKKTDWVNKFNKIVLVTRRLTVCILQRVEQPGFRTFIIASDAVRSDFFSEESKVFSPDKSIAHYASWLRAYESLLFWEYVRKYNDQKKFFVNASIKWKDDLETVRGYLDFGQTSTDHFLMELYKISIERTIGFFNKEEKATNRFCYFKNIDPLTKTITDIANSTFFDELEKNNENQIYIGSVFASGKSREDAMLYVGSSNEVLSIHFFSHPSSMIQVPHLFSWPPTEWIQKNFEASDIQYERVGRTHVIAEHGYKSFTMPRYHPVTRKSVYYRNPRSTYEDWQNERSEIVSYGHFEFEGKHDLFKINIAKLMEESFMFNDNLPNFLVSEFFLALNGNIESDLSFEGLKFAEFIKQRKIQNEKVQRVELIIYPSNSVTSFIVDKIKENFTDNLNSKIFALMPVNKERVGSSLLISPLVLEPIRKHLEGATANKRVLLFDSSVISGRTRKELKHLLLSLDAEEVITLSIVDRFRLPFRVANVTKHKSYWRLDVPRLGSSNMCPICKGLREIEMFKDHLASGFALSRLKQWAEGWKVISYFNPKSDHGVKPSPIPQVEKRFGIVFNKQTKEFDQLISNDEKEKGLKNEIILKNSLGITLYATEVHSMTSRDDLAIKLCETVKDLNDAGKIEILSAQLLLFSNEYSKNIHFEMVKKLFFSCKAIRYPTNHTILACIVILIQDQSIHRKLLTEIAKKGYRDLDDLNFDAEIMLAYILKFQSSTSDFAPEKIVRLLKFKDEETYLSLYQLFHNEIYNEYGNIHVKPLIAFYEKKEFSKDDLLNATLRDAINSISKLEYILSKIPTWLLRKNFVSDVMPSRFQQDVIKILKEFYVLFETALDKYNIEGKDSKVFEDEIKGLKFRVEKELINQLKVFHSYMFLPLKSEGNIYDTPIQEYIKSQIESITKHQWTDQITVKENKYFTARKLPLVRLSKNVASLDDALVNGRKNAWVIFDDFIQQEIKYIIINAAHAKGELRDLWSVNALDTETANMWINISYLKDFVQIDFANVSSKDANEIKNKIEQKKKEGLIHLVENLKGKLDVINESKADDLFIVKATLYIPLI